MIRSTLRAAAMLLLVALAACAPQGDPDTQALVVYAAGPRPLAQAIADSYTQRTGVPVELFSATTGQIMAKLEAERYNRRADVIILASPVAAEHLRQQGRLLTLQLNDPARFDPAWSSPDGAYHSPNGAAVGIAVRADRHREGIEWTDVLGGEPGWRVVMPSPTRSGSSGEFVLAYTIVHGEEAWRQFSAGVDRGMEFAAANSQAISGLLSGTYEAIVGAVDYLILREIERGAPLRLVFPESGAVIVERPVMIMAGTARADAARAFVEHCFSDEAQALSAAAGLIPAQLHARERLTRPMPSAVIPVDAREGLARLQLTMRRFQYQLEGAGNR